MNDQITVTSAGGVEVKLDLVGLGGRSYAFVMDWHIRILVALAWFLFGMLALTGSFTVQDSKAFSSGTSLFYLVLLPSLAIYFLYHPVLEIAMHGRTPGKRMAGIRIVAKDGSSASGGAILLRNIFRLIDSLPTMYVLGIIVVLLNKQHLRIGDMAAGTVLIYEEQASKKRLDMIINSAGAQALSTQQRELVAEILERWTELEPATRRKMAQDLLQKFAQALPTGDGHSLDNALKNSLQQLLK